MVKRWGAAILVLLGLFAGKPRAEGVQVPGNANQAPATAAMAWDRDFDLLLEIRKDPTKDQIKAEDLRQSLLQERQELVARVADFKARLSTVLGAFTTEALLNEMLLQGVADMRSVHENLQAWIARDEARIKEIDARLQKIAERGGA
jgi:hypothetical protein